MKPLQTHTRAIEAFKKRNIVGIDMIVSMARKPFIAVTDPYLQKEQRTDFLDFEQACACSNSEEQESEFAEDLA